MSIQPAKKPAVSRPIGLSIAAALSWLPLISIVVAQFVWIRLPATFTTHWNFAGIGDARAAPHTAFWDFAPPAAVLALTVTALVATVGNDISRRAGAIGIGLLAWLLGTITSTWFGLGLVAAHPKNAGTHVSILLAAGALFGALVSGAIALPRRRSVSAPV